MLHHLRWTLCSLTKVPAGTDSISSRIKAVFVVWDETKCELFCMLSRLQSCLLTKTYEWWQKLWPTLLIFFLLTLMIVSPLQVLSGCAIIVRGQPRGGPPPERQINLSNIRAGALARRAMQGQPDTKDIPDEVTGFILSLCLCVCLCLFTQGWSLCCWELL